MLLPRFSLRTSLALITAAAFFSVIAGRALMGGAWAVGISAAVGFVGFALLVHLVFFGMSCAFARLLGVEEVVARTSRGGIERETGQAPSGANDP